MTNKGIFGSVNISTTSECTLVSPVPSTFDTVCGNNQDVAYLKTVDDRKKKKNRNKAVIHLKTVDDGKNMKRKAVMSLPLKPWKKKRKKKVYQSRGLQRLISDFFKPLKSASSSSSSSSYISKF